MTRQATDQLLSSLPRSMLVLSRELHRARRLLDRLTDTEPLTQDELFLAIYCAEAALQSGDEAEITLRTKLLRAWCEIAVSPRSTRTH